MFSKVSRFSLIPILILTLLIVFSCRKKDKIDTNPSLKLTFSSDTVFFDTVFTTVGSVTQRLMVHNYNSAKVMVSSIRLGGGSNSVFSLNIDGTPAPSLSDVEIPAGDSIFIFVRVTLNPSNQNNPLIIADSILFSTNGNLQKVALVAWGQDAFFYHDKKINGNITWDSIKPHVIYGFLRVDTGSMLTISAGTKIYFHKSAYLAISHLSTLVVTGNVDHPVRFLGDRLDAFYRDLPGQWAGIYLEKGSQNNTIDHAIIKNGNVGIAIDSASITLPPVLTLKNTIIQNMAANDIYAYATTIYSENCVLGDCGGSSLALDFGGSYEFRQLTIGNYWSSSVRLAPALYLSNYTTDSLGHYLTNPLTKAEFGNAIIYGAQDEELSFDKYGQTELSYTFDHCLLKTLKNTGDPTLFISCLVNKDPGFVDVLKFDYRIDSISPARHIGNPFVGVPNDIKGIPRIPDYDLGAYQYVPK